MSKNLKLADNVQAFLDRASELVGNFERESWSMNRWCECTDLEIESPIEQIFSFAFWALAKTNYIQPAEDPVFINGHPVCLGLSLFPQHKIGNFRVDFLARYSSGRHAEKKEVIVECDGHQFHEMSEPERRQEKARDRFLQSKGYKVFRFTGSEIVKEPYRVAADVISEITGYDRNGFFDFIRASGAI